MNQTAPVLVHAIDGEKVYVVVIMIFCINVHPGVRVGGAVSMNPSPPQHKEFPPLPPAPMETVEDCEWLQICVGICGEVVNVTNKIGEC